MDFPHFLQPEGHKKVLFFRQIWYGVAEQQYTMLYGNPSYSSLVDAMHQLAGILKDVPKSLIEAYRGAAVKHADETGWRTDGQNGYSWLFCRSDIP
jgi:hypothetical protein